MSTDLEEQYDKIYRYCYFKVQSRETAEDITQETFLRFLESKTYKDTGKSLHYLYTIARNLCIDEARRKKEEPLENEIPENSPEDRMLTNIALKTALSGLNETDREFLLLRYVNEVPVSELSKIYQISRFAVYRKILHAVKSLKSKLREEDFHEYKKLKASLKKEFEAPAPQRKKEFLQKIPRTPLSHFSFICSQIQYIRKWIWAAAVFIYAATFICVEFLNKNMLSGISAFMPILALSVITESGRPEAYKMAEFEMSTRFSLKSIVLARLGILGVMNLILTLLLLPLAYKNGELSFLQTGLCLLYPYLLTVFTGLWAVRKIHGREDIYVCTGIALGVSLGHSLFFQSFPALYRTQNILWSLGTLFILCAAAGIQSYKIIRQTEELSWCL